MEELGIRLARRRQQSVAVVTLCHEHFSRVSDKDEGKGGGVTLPAARLLVNHRLYVPSSDGDALVPASLGHERGQHSAPCKASPELASRGPMEHLKVNKCLFNEQRERPVE